MFMVIFGAGASYDSVPSRAPAVYPRKLYPPSDDLFSRPPLAKELFLPEGFFADCVHSFPECWPIVPYLRSEENLERTLERLQDEAATDPERVRQIAAIRFYLQVVISRCGHHWERVARGITNYATLLDQLRRCRRAEDPVLLVTFNYDKMIEEGLSSVGIAVSELSHYINHDAFKLFKLHGSVDWAREVDTVIKVTDRHAWEIVRELIQKAGELEISDRYRMVTTGQPINAVENIPLFPAIAIPVETKSGFECPSAHIECLRAHLGKVTKIIIVGMEGNRKTFSRSFEWCRHRQDTGAGHRRWKRSWRGGS